MIIYGLVKFTNENVKRQVTLHVFRLNFAGSFV